MTQAAVAGEDREARLQQARRLREAGRPEEALAVLEALERDHPRFSRLHQERGRCHLNRGDGPAAVAALSHAVALNPALPAAWDMLGRLHRLRDEAAEARDATARLSALNVLPSRLVAAHSLHADGDLQPAAQALRDHLREDPGDLGAARLLARIQADQGALEEALALLRTVLARAPDYEEARLDYARLLMEDREPALARREAERLLASRPSERTYRKALAAASIALGDDETVIELASILMDGAEPGAEVADLRLWRANALKAIGRRDEAVVDYRASLAARPDNGVAWFALSNLKTHVFDDDEIARMQAAEQRTETRDRDRVYLRFALGRALEHQGDHAGSWRYYAGGNALHGSGLRYRPEAARRCAANLCESLTGRALAGADGGGDDGGELEALPIFVLGLPRSGSTLVEQILASHPLVEGAQELGRIERYAGEVGGRDAHEGLPLRPEACLDLSAAAAAALGARYLEQTRPYRRLGRPVFVDKTPDNFWHIGLIQRILPRAKIIDVRRAPMACGFGLYKQLFGTSQQGYSYALPDIAERYRLYLDVMRRWDGALPGKVLRVHYEDLVEDLEGEVRRMLDHCGLPFDPACLLFHETARAVRTPSSEQVRRPIGREGLDQWRRYAPWLTPLQDAMGDALTRYRA